MSKPALTVHLGKRTCRCGMGHLSNQVCYTLKYSQLKNKVAEAAVRFMACGDRWPLDKWTKKLMIFEDKWVDVLHLLKLPGEL